MTKLSITFSIPAHNEEKNLLRLLSSIEKQKYPKNKVKIIVVNDSSTDKTASIAKRYGAKVIDVKTKDCERNKGIGLYAAKTDLIFFPDADMELCDVNFINNIVAPFLHDSEIIGSFTKEFALKGNRPESKSSLLRYVSYHPLQQDPLIQYFSPSIESTIVQKRKGYFLCEFVPGKIPAVGRVVYRRKQILETDVSKDERFIDMETTEIVARAGYRKFAYVPKARIKHFHAEGLKTLVGKRLRNLNKELLVNYEKRYYKWFDPSSAKDLIRIIAWVVYANLFVPALIRGIVLMVKNRDMAFLWEPVVTIVTTDVILWGFLTNKKGRKIAMGLIRTLACFEKE